MNEEKPQAKPVAAKPAFQSEKPAEMEHRAMETITGELKKAIKLDLATSGMSPEAPARTPRNGQRRANRNEPPRQVMSLRHVSGNRRGGGRNYRFDYADPEVPRIQPLQRRGAADFSRAYLKKEFFVYSNAAQNFFERNYEPVDRTLIVTSAIYTLTGGREAGDAAVAKMHEHFTSVQQMLEEAIANTQQVLKEGGVTDGEVSSYDHKRFYTPPVHTPLAMRFLSIVSLYDRLIARIESCWINGIIDDHGRQSTLGHWNAEMTKAVRQVFAIRAEAWNLARNTGHAQQAKAIEQKVARENEQEKGLVGKDVPVKTEAKPAVKPVTKAASKPEDKITEAKKEQEAAPSSPTAPAKVEAPSAPAKEAAPKPVETPTQPAENVSHGTTEAAAKA